MSKTWTEIRYEKDADAFADVTWGKWTVTKWMPWTHGRNMVTYRRATAAEEAAWNRQHPEVAKLPTYTEGIRAGLAPEQARLASITDFQKATQKQIEVVRDVPVWDITKASDGAKVDSKVGKAIHLPIILVAIAIGVLGYWLFGRR